MMIGIRHTKCGYISFHPKDVKEKYCGHCHEYLLEKPHTMQFILNEEEYKKLIHKDRIKGPVDEFIKTLNKIFGPDACNNLLIKEEIIAPLKQSIRTLSIKLDL